jgi:hypothetical protein
MTKKKPRSTAAFDQPIEGVYDSMATPGSKFVAIEDVPSGDLNPEEICLLCERMKQAEVIEDPEVLELVEELIELYRPGFLSRAQEEYDSSMKTKILVSKGLSAHECEVSHAVPGQKKLSCPPSSLALLVMFELDGHIDPDDEE